MNAQEARQRIKSLPRTPEGCWEWQGSTSMGYGYLYLDGRQQRAHRVAYMLFVGLIPDDLCVLHTCDNRRCCCPQHIVLGTRAQNMREMYERGRSSTSDQRKTFGRRKLTEADVRLIDKRYDEGWSQTKIAKSFGVHQTAISKVLRRESWQHLDKS
jgi:hypothetical protein